MNKRVLLILSVSLGYFVIVACSYQSLTVEIPAGFSGWVALEFTTGSCRYGLAADRPSRISIDASGRGCVALATVPGTMGVRFFRVDKYGKRLEELKASGWGKGGQIWGEMTSEGDRLYRFFVGPERDFRAAAPPPL